MTYLSDQAKRNALARLTRPQRIAVLRAEAEKTLTRLRAAKPKKPAPKTDEEEPPLYEIDILAHEMKTGAPHWLSAERGRRENVLSEERKQEIRDKHRAKAANKAPTK